MANHGQPSNIISPKRQAQGHDYKYGSCLNCRHDYGVAFLLDNIQIKCPPLRQNFYSKHFYGPHRFL